MRKSRLALVVLVCCFGVWALGCGDDDGDSGTAPAISNLTHDATTLTLNVQGLISGSFDFTDPDGDAELMQVDIVMPDGQSGVVPDTVLTGVAGLTAGTINWNLSLTPTQAGTYDFTLRVVDEQGNVSNELQESFDAQ
jgi:hypothetical protein